METASTERYQVMVYVSYMVENQKSYIGSYIRIFEKTIQESYPTAYTDKNPLETTKPFGTGIQAF